MGELERCRSIYEHLSQFVNPYSSSAANKVFWTIWEKFEMHYGDKDTYTDFLRTKKTVELRYSQVVENFTKKDQAAEQVSEENEKMEDEK